MTGIALVVAFVIAIAAMIVMISKFKIHPFISIMLVSLVFGLVDGVRYHYVACDGLGFKLAQITQSGE